MFVEDEELDSTERVCDILLMCIVIVMNYGLRNGGGVGDIFRKFFKDVSIFCFIFKFVWFKFWLG